MEKDDDDDSGGECVGVEEIDDEEEEEAATKSPSVLPSDGMNRRRGCPCGWVDGIAVALVVVVTTTVDVGSLVITVELVGEETNDARRGRGEKGHREKQLLRIAIGCMDFRECMVHCSSVSVFGIDTVVRK